MRNDSISIQFDWAEPITGPVLALSSERIGKNLPSDLFQDKLVNFVGRDFENGDNIVCIIKSRTDPKPEFYIKAFTKRVIGGEKWHQGQDPVCKIKRYVVNEDELMNSLKKIYNIIWGQCREQLQATVKCLNDYDTKKKGETLFGF